MGWKMIKQICYILLNPTTEASPACNPLQLCIETPNGSIRCLFMAWFLDSEDIQVLYIFLWLQVSNQPDQACWSQSGMPSGWGKGATPWPARLRLVRDDRGSWAAPATLGQPSYHHFWSTVLTPQFCCINTILWYCQTYDPCDMFHFKPPS